MNLNKENIDALEEAAKKATPGPWEGFSGGFVESSEGYEVCQVLAHHPQNEKKQGYNRKYIAAANPAVVLALINKVRELEQKNLRLLSISAENYNKLTGWMDACLKAEDERDKLLQAAKQAAEEIRRCDYTPARSTLLVAIAQVKGT